MSALITLNSSLINDKSEYHGFKNEDVVLLTDDTTERRHLPTRQNLINAMRWLVRSAKCNDSLFFHCSFFFFLHICVFLIILDSGHGGQVEDKDGDEVDGFDEGSLWALIQKTDSFWFTVIFPLDYKEAGFIVDDVCILVFENDVSRILIPV